MPAIYMSYAWEPGDTMEERRSKLYLGIISAGEQAYTLGAAIAECRKHLEILDRTVDQLRQDFAAYKIATSPEPPTGENKVNEPEQLRSAYEEHFECLGGIYCLPDTKDHSILCPRNKGAEEFRLFKLGWDAHKKRAEPLPREEPGK